MAKTHKVIIAKMHFVPESLSVAAGDTVEWTNGMDFAHTVTANDSSFDSREIDPNQTFSQVFGSAGTFPYHCEIHPSMKGSVTVT